MSTAKRWLTLVLIASLIAALPELTSAAGTHSCSEISEPGYNNQPGLSGCDQNIVTTKDITAAGVMSAGRGFVSSAGTPAVTAQTTGTTGVYAKGATYAGYFDGGKVYIKDKLGIGTSNLQVAEKVRIYDTTYPALTIEGPSSVSAQLGLATQAGFYSDEAKVNDLILRSNNGNVIIAAKNANEGILLTTGASDSTKLAILNSGNVGIGTSSPITGVKLDVRGVVSTTSEQDGGALRFYDLANTGNWFEIRFDKANNWGVFQRALVPSTDGALSIGTATRRWGTGHFGGAVEANQIKTTTSTIDLKNDGSAYFGGNVGIGATNPGTKLEISGGNVKVANGDVLVEGGKIIITKFGAPPPDPDGDGHYAAGNYGGSTTTIAGDGLTTNNAGIIVDTASPYYDCEPNEMINPGRVYKGSTFWSKNVQRDVNCNGANDELRHYRLDAGQKNCACTTSLSSVATVDGQLYNDIRINCINMGTAQVEPQCPACSQEVPILRHNYQCVYDSSFWQ